MPSLTIQSDLFRQALGAVISSAATSDQRPILKAVRLRITRGPRVELAACDNYRAAFADVGGEIVKSGTLPEETVVPLIAAKALLKALPAKSPKLGVNPPLRLEWRRDGTLRASLNGWSLDIRPVEGHYPNTDAIQPSGPIVTELAVDSRLLADLALAMGGIGLTDKLHASGTVRIIVRQPKVKGIDPRTVAYEIQPVVYSGKAHAILMPVRVAWALPE